MSYCTHCGIPQPEGGNFCNGCGASLLRGTASSVRPHMVPAILPNLINSDSETLRRIADYERISAILWLILGIIQVLMILTALVGIWNIFAAISRFKINKMIVARDPEVPSMYEGIAGLIIIGLLNLLFGGAIGVLFVVFDFVIRDMVLKNSHLFVGLTEDVAPQEGRLTSKEA